MTAIFSIIVIPFFVIFCASSILVGGKGLSWVIGRRKNKIGWKLFSTFIISGIVVLSFFSHQKYLEQEGLDLISTLDANDLVLINGENANNQFVENLKSSFSDEKNSLYRRTNEFYEVCIYKNNNVIKLLYFRDYRDEELFWVSRVIEIGLGATATKWVGFVQTKSLNNLNARVGSFNEVYKKDAWCLEVNSDAR